MTELVHFYSYATGVSLELPVGFEAVGRDASSASYAILGDDDVTVLPGTQLQVRVVATFDRTTDGERAAQVDVLAAALAEHGELLDRGVRVVDDERVVTVTTRTDDGMLALASATSTEQRLLSIVALARDEETLAVFDGALDSVRFVEL